MRYMYNQPDIPGDISRHSAYRRRPERCLVDHIAQPLSVLFIQYDNVNGLNNNCDVLEW